ncbi:MAG: DUF547 domain-containing protein [Marinobacter sp.]
MIKLRLFIPYLMVFALFLPLSANADDSVFEPYQYLLTEYLTEATTPDGGLVSAFDYEAALAASQTQALLADQREQLAEFDIGTLKGKAESIAFWINAYNFFMVNQILTDRPGGELVGSVWDYGGRVNPFVDSVFERRSFVIGGQEFSLSEIEKNILLGKEYANKGWKDARIHFAVNCASVGCPPLRQVVYTADNLEDLLTENTRRAFRTDRHLIVDGDTLHVTELFKWYDEDFKEVSGSRKAFIKAWADSSRADRVEATTEMAFIDYDWALNKPANFSEFR